MGTRTRTRGGTRGRRGAAQQIRAWQDDPISGLDQIDRPVPDLDSGPLSLRIKGQKPAPGVYDPGTKGFRYWTAAEALGRGTEFWGGVLPAGTTWQPGAPLRVGLDEGIDLNAYYSRQGLTFFRRDIDGQTFYSGESPDVLCHELGHGILDAIRPELWDVMSGEAAAFHESFGDMSALLCAVQLPSVRQATLLEANGNVYRSSPLSRVAEQLGWAIRQFRPDIPEADCLRNAVNSFFYQEPEGLPTNAPSSVLSSEPHSFARVFTGGFFEAFAKMLITLAADPSEDDLAQASKDAGRLLASAASNSPIVPDYYSQVAAHMISADAELFGGRYRNALVSAFLRRGILSIDSVSATAGLPAAAASDAGSRRAFAAVGTGSPAGEVARLALSGERYGLGSRPLFFAAPIETRRFQVAAAAPDLGAVQPRSAQRVANAFVEELFRRGRVDTAGQVDERAGVVHLRAHTTHKIVTDETGTMTLVRERFDCGLGGGE
jgi:hypothetical protein